MVINRRPGHKDSMCWERISWSTNENDAVLLCPQAYNNLLPGSVSSLLDCYTLKVTAIVSVTLPQTYREQTWASHWFFFGIAIGKVPGTNSLFQVSCLSPWSLKLGNWYSCSHTRVSKHPPADFAIHDNTAKEQPNLTSDIPCILSLTCNWSIETSRD